MVTIIFESHGTTFDNEAHLASGHNDVALSHLDREAKKFVWVNVRQAKRMKLLPGFKMVLGKVAKLKK